MDLFNNIILIIAGAIPAFLIAALWMRQKMLHKQMKERESFQEEIQQLQASLSVAESTSMNMKENADRYQHEYRLSQEAIVALKEQLAIRNTEHKNLILKLEEQGEEVSKIRQQFVIEFENIASKLLKNNAKDFADSNQKQIAGMLEPFKDRIEKFEKTIQNTHIEQIKEQNTLRNELKHLHELNQKMTSEAQNLTKALKGDSKQQGNWGEMILEKVLERSGLQKNIEYKREVVLQKEDQGYNRPDVVVYLPENKHIIIDSKVSLTAFEKSINASAESERLEHMKAHLLSVKNHIHNLSSKQYHQSGELDSPDFVLLFMPVESAFSAALQADHNLFNEAWENHIVIVSPTTLLATLKTVASLWRHEKQTQNALKIAQQGSLLYDRVAAFLTDFEKMEKPLDQAKENYLALRNKLSGSNKSIAATANRMKELGIKSSKKIPDQFNEKEK